ncbi:MAG: hypothetical protein AUJ55_03015 [Proteobacteria bacterium CG1_02_64_396]|nr:MAG: hypothetical protein AUJ55_03015 [Proteobacteria bacterium CG1_02_64_396]
MLLLRSLIYNLFHWTITVFYAVAIILCWPLPWKIRWQLGRGWSLANVAALRILCGIKLDVQGLENIPDHPVVVVSKHQSAWETVAFPVFMPPFNWVLKKELLYIPFFGQALLALEQIAIDRSAGRQALKQLNDEGGKRIAAGRSVTIFPEGTRIAPGQVGDYQMGGIWLAKHAGVPLLPIAHNAGKVWPRKGFIKRPGTISVRIGKAIALDGNNKAILANVKEAIEGMMAQLPQ